MELDEDKIDETVLALLSLSMTRGELGKGWILMLFNKNKSVWFTDANYKTSSIFGKRAFILPIL